VEKSLNLTFTPDKGNNAKFVTLKVFEESQVNLFDKGDSSKMTSLGATQIVSWDNNPDTGQLAWKESLAGAKTYYVQLFNDSDFTIAYWLFSEQVGNVEQTPTPQRHR